MALPLLPFSHTSEMGAGRSKQGASSALGSSAEGRIPGAPEPGDPSPGRGQLPGEAEPCWKDWMGKSVGERWRRGSELGMVFLPASPAKGSSRLSSVSLFQHGDRRCWDAAWRTSLCQRGPAPPAPRAVRRGFAAKPGLKPVLNRLRGAAELCQGDLSSPEHSELQGLGEVKARPKWGGGEGLWSRCGENLESSGGCGLGLGAEGAQEEGFGAQSQQRLGLFVHQS